MERIMLKSKIHMATVTEANLNYFGSISIGPDMRKKADMMPFEKVEIYNCNNGQRFSTYVIETEKEGEICLNGAAARLVEKGDKVIIASYAQYSEREAAELKPYLVFVDDKNSVKEIRRDVPK
jgi:aspartate 1-decarboxylase